MTGPSVSLGSSEGSTSRTVTDTLTATGACKPSEFPSSTSPCNTEKSAPEPDLWNGYLSSIRRGSPVRVTYTLRLDLAFAPVSPITNRLPEKCCKRILRRQSWTEKGNKKGGDSPPVSSNCGPLLAGGRRSFLGLRCADLPQHFVHPASAVGIDINVMMARTVSVHDRYSRVGIRLLDHKRQVMPVIFTDRTSQNYKVKSQLFKSVKHSLAPDC